MKKAGPFAVNLKLLNKQTTQSRGDEQYFPISPGYYCVYLARPNCKYTYYIRSWNSRIRPNE